MGAARLRLLTTPTTPKHEPPITRETPRTERVLVSTFTGPTMTGATVSYAQWMETNGRVPELEFHRDQYGRIAGFAIYEEVTA